MNMLNLKSIGILFPPILWTMFCKAKLNPPSVRLVFAPGEDGRIVWTYCGDTNEITNQTLSFTGASSNLVKVTGGKVLKRVSNGLDFQFILPLTLILKNINQTYNGTYIMEVRVGNPHKTVTRSPVHVFIAGVDGNPPAVVTWYKGSGRIISGEEMAILTIARVDRDDNGLYRCEAKGDEKAKAEKTVELIINYMKISTTSIVDGKTDWLVTAISVLSGIIFGILFCCLIFLCYGRRWLVKKSQMSQSHDGKTNTANTTCQEIDLSNMDDEGKEDIIDPTYQGLDVSKMNKKDNNYQPLLSKNNTVDQSHEGDDYVIPNTSP
ncbi:uncharacterized protein LOC124450777 isoform X2 [Xenia sp. Carnegie-2017]|uniref:uncharacterized protein LOC124450777 isoform X2 n=1 Tax=Xenia sp. Carnegie-2017 TaxID=2897299 RepID=UPI001F03D3C6|nr:uncharacterized protein LOC124450777 isoform X2 [Xenia sp. Carnegie-2017]